MKYFKISLSFVLVILMSCPVQAKMIEGLEVSNRDQVSKTTWEAVKDKVTTWWSGLSQPAGRKPASEPTEPQKPVVVEQPATAPAEVAATVDNWSTAPKIVAPGHPEAKPVPKVNENANRLKAVAASVSASQTVKQVHAAKAPSAELALTKSGVPTFSLNQTKKGKKGSKTIQISVSNIPLLDIGQEASVIHQDFTIDAVEIANAPKFKLEPIMTPAVLSEKDFRKILGTPLLLDMGPEKMKFSSLTEDQKVTADKVGKVEYQLLTEKSLQEVMTRPLTPEEMKFLRALILYEQKDKCHMAAGLFYDLTESKTYQSSANFYLGICLHKMGLFSESVDRLLKGIEGGEPEYVRRGIETLVNDLPEEFEIRVGKVLQAVLDKSEVDKAIRIKANFIIAKGALKKENYELAHQFADSIPESHLLYRQAQYIMAIAEYATGAGSTSLSRLEKLRAQLEKKPDTELSSLVALNLGRVAFQEKKYKESSKYFQDISKGHPLWIQALTEQGWAQLMGQDNEGAIGNMHSIQSPFFNSVYKPESFVVRTIGYLNLCQYPDAYRSLSPLEREYRPWYSKMQSFMTNTKMPKDYYAAMAKYLASPSQTEVGGLLFQVLREMGRHRDYLNLQQSINNRIDEGEQYAFIRGVIKKDTEKVKWLKTQAKSRLTALEAKIKASKKDPTILKDLNQIKQDRATELALIDYYDFQISVFEEGKISLQGFEDKAKGRLAKLRADLIEKAGDALKHRLHHMVKDLDGMFDNNEFLRYEVFAGSGENIRQEMSGGEKRVSAKVKPANKDLSWDFDGEYWEDEIGHYKSSLKDNCPRGQASR